MQIGTDARRVVGFVLWWAVAVQSACAQRGPEIPTAAHRVADQLARKFVLEAVMGGKTFSQARDEAAGWRLEEMLAEALLSNYPSLPTDNEVVRLRVLDGSETLATYGRSTPEKLGEHLEAVLSIASHDRAHLNETNPNLDQQFEIKRNEGVTETSAAEIVRLAALCRREFRPEFIESVGKIKSSFERVIAAHPDLLKPFAEAKPPSEELRRSRARVQRLLTQARAKAPA